MSIAPSSNAARKPRRLRRLVGFAASAALLLFLLPAAPSVANGVQLNTLKDGGVLRLHFDATSADYFRLDTLNFNAAGQITGSTPTTRRQIISTQGKCGAALTEASPATPLGVSLGTSAFVNGTAPSQTFAGLFADGFGIGGKGSNGNGQPCGRIDPGEVLRLKMPTGKLADYAELDLEGKFGVTIRVELLLGGTLVHSRLIDPSDLNDDGPDSGDGDNYRKRLPESGSVLFDEIRIGPAGSSGSVSLEGGADGTGACANSDDVGCGAFSLGGALGNTMDSLFHLVEADGVLACGGSATESNGGNTTTLKLENTPGCQPVPYSIDISGDGKEVEVRKDLTNNPNAVFTWTVAWPLEDGAYPAPPTQIDYGDGAGLHDMEICDADGPDTDSFPDLPTGESYCVVSSGLVLDTASGDMKVSESYFGKADPLAKR